MIDTMAHAVGNVSIWHSCSVCDSKLVCDSSRKGKSAKHVATTEILIEKQAIWLQKKRVRACA